MAKKRAFDSVKEFFKSTDLLEETIADEAAKKAVEEKRSSIVKSFSSTTVGLSSLNATKNAEIETVKEIISAGIQSEEEYTKEKAKEYTSQLEEVMKDYSIKSERRTYWINQLCDFFNIDPNMTTEDKIILIDQQLMKNDMLLAYVTSMMENDKGSV